MNPRQDALQIFNAAVTAVQPAQLLYAHLSFSGDALKISNHTLPLESFRNLYVIGAGKAAAAMAVVTEKIIGKYITEGIVVTKYGHALPCNRIKILEGAHPVPDEHCENAVKATVQLLQRATEHDIIICLISGGASALWCDVPEGITLEEIQTTFDKLIKSGASIQEINTVRKHLSSIKGGQLAKYCNGARLFSLIISDVPGDDVSVIASGPTIADETTFEDAYTVLIKYDLFQSLPWSIQAYINAGISGKIADTPKPGNPVFWNTVNTNIGSNAVALKAASAKARDLGYSTHINTTLIIGDVEEEAKKLIDSVMAYNSTKPACLLQGGETTVRVTGNGKGGRNQHFVLAALNFMDTTEDITSHNNVLILSGGTDGTDGPTDAAGAIGDASIIQSAKEKALFIQDYLHDHNAYNFFEQTGGLLITGATQTNVMDIMLAIVY